MERKRKQKELHWTAQKERKEEKNDKKKKKITTKVFSPVFFINGYFSHKRKCTNLIHH